MKSLTTITLISALMLAVVLGCTTKRNSSSATNRKDDGKLIAEKSRPKELSFVIPPDSVPATEITTDFDNKRSDLKAAVRKWRNKRVTFHGTVYTVEKGEDGDFKVSLAGHDGMFTVFCRDIPHSQARLVEMLKEDQTTVAISGVILGSGTTGLVPGRIDDDVLAEKCRIVE